MGDLALYDPPAAHQPRDYAHHPLMMSGGMALVPVESLSASVNLRRLHASTRRRLAVLELALAKSGEGPRRGQDVEEEEEDMKLRLKSREQLQALLPPGAHVPDFGVVPLLPAPDLPGCFGSSSKGAIEGDTHPTGRRMRGAEKSLGASTRPDPRRDSLEASGTRLTTDCGTATLM